LTTVADCELCRESPGGEFLSLLVQRKEPKKARPASPPFGFPRLTRPLGRLRNSPSPAARSSNSARRHPPSGQAKRGGSQRGRANRACAWGCVANWLVCFDKTILPAHNGGAKRCYCGPVLNDEFGVNAVLLPSAHQPSGQVACQMQGHRPQRESLPLRDHEVDAQGPVGLVPIRVEQSRQAEQE